MQQPLKPFTLAAYSGVALPMAAMGMPIAVYLPRFYSEGLGLSLITVGLIFTLARVWDVRKHWIALAVPILVVSVYQVFIPSPEDVSGGYLLFWLIMLYVGYTMMAISHQSWGAELADSYDERTRLFGWREIFVIGGMTIVLALPALLESTGIDDQQSKVASMGWFCIINVLVAAAPCRLKRNSHYSCLTN